MPWLATSVHGGPRGLRRWQELVDGPVSACAASKRSATRGEPLLVSQSGLLWLWALGGRGGVEAVDVVDGGRLWDRTEADERRTRSVLVVSFIVGDIWRLMVAVFRPPQGFFVVGIYTHAKIQWGR